MPKPEYIAHLRANGATEDDIKALTEGSFAVAAIKSFDAAEARVTAESVRLKAEADAAIAAYKAKADDWYQTVAEPNLAQSKADATKAAAEAARLRALVASSTDEGLRKVAEEMGYKLDGSTAPPKTPTSEENKIDTSKFVTTDSIAGLADQVGANLARMQDMVLEHMQLFPTQRLNVARLREEAVAAKKNVYEYWEQKYKVSDARAAADAAATKAREDAIRKEERDKVTAELASTYGNPNTAPPATSTNVFVPRPKDGREKAPWEGGLDGANGANDRVARATKNYMEKSARTN